MIYLTRLKPQNHCLYHKVTIYIRISNVRFALRAFFENRKKLGSHNESDWWPGDQDVNGDPNDPLTR